MLGKNHYLSIAVLFAGSLLSGCQTSGNDSKAREDSTVLYDCSSSKEYITALTYLRDRKEFKLPEKDAQGLALKVSKGCSNAAYRFVSTVNLLLQVKLNAASALKLGLMMANSSDEVALAFKAVFKTAFQESGLDLSQPEAIQIANRFSAGFKGDPELASEDFVALAEYCVDEGELNLPRPTCAKFATELAALGETFEEPVAVAFMTAMEFIAEDSDGPKLTTSDTIALATELVKISPHAPQNFSEAYQFAIEKDGLSLSRTDAIRFAKQVASYTRTRPESLKLQEPKK